MGAVWSGRTDEIRSPTQDETLPTTESTEVDNGVAESASEKYEEGELADFYDRRKVEREAEMERFRRELGEKRRAREEALSCLKREVHALREEKSKREGVEEELDGLRVRASQAEDLEKQVNALKDVAGIGKQILAIREKQVSELSKKLKNLEETGAEYEKEVKKVKRLRELYEEREKAREAEHRVELERERARTSVAETRLRLASQEGRQRESDAQQLAETNELLDEKVAGLSKGLEEARSEVSELRLELASRSEEAYEARSQLGLVNGLFAGVLTGGSEDVDRLARLLEENRPLLLDLTEKGRIDQVASVLMDVATPRDDHQGVSNRQPSEDISHNLTKVWRVMVELLSHRKNSGGDGVPESCYKSVETPKGPRLVISPSQTFIRLKDLILEKNSLVKEVGRLKVLNGHLETRLEEQEKRLSLVTSELHKTWGVVNKLRNQHKQLHTQEKILRFELQHKRHLLTELKKELEICREQWEKARLKNSQTEEDWKILREEFALRKRVGGGESTESGFEDEADSLGSEEADEEDSGNPERILTPTQLDEEDNPVFLVKPSTLSVDASAPNPSSEPPQCIDERLSNFDLGKGVGHNQVETVAVSSEPLSKEECITTSQEISMKERQLELSPSTKELKDHFEPLQSLEERIETLKEGKGSLQSETQVLSDSLLTEEEASTSKLAMLATTEYEHPGDCSDVNNQISETSCQENNVNPLVYSISVTYHDTQVQGNEEGDHGESAGLSKGEPNIVQRVEDQVMSTAESSTKNSEKPDLPNRTRTTEEILEAREARLKRLEEQCKSLFTKMSNTSVRSDVISNKLEELHQHYGDNTEATGTRDESPVSSEIKEENCSTSESEPQSDQP